MSLKFQMLFQQNPSRLKKDLSFWYSKSPFLHETLSYLQNSGLPDLCSKEGLWFKILMYDKFFLKFLKT